MNGEKIEQPAKPDAVPKPPRRWALLKRRPCSVPTWRGWLLLLLCIFCFAMLLVKTIHPFLSVTKPVTGGALVVEGWAPDYVLRSAIEEFKRNPYTKLYVTGGPLQKGVHLSEYGTHAQLGYAVLVRLGFDTNFLQAVPAPKVQQDRTYASALALQKWFEVHGEKPTKVNVVTVGPHSRRSRLLFEKGLKGCSIGVIAMPPDDYDPARWWTTSAGVRTVIDEVVAYVYARFFFWPN